MLCDALSKDDADLQGDVECLDDLKGSWGEFKAARRTVASVAAKSVAAKDVHVDIFLRCEIPEIVSVRPDFDPELVQVVIERRCRRKCRFQCPEVVRTGFADEPRFTDPVPVRRRQPGNVFDVFVPLGGAHDVQNG